MNKIIKRIISFVLAFTIYLPSAIMYKAEAAAIGGWNIVHMGSCDADVTIDEEVTYRGSGSLKIVNRSPGGGVYMSIEQIVPVEAGKKYYVGAKVRLEKATSAFMLIDWDWNTQKSITDLGSTLTWTNFQWMYVPTTTGNVTLRTIVEGVGTAWFDDFIFMESGSDKNLLKNSTFDIDSSQAVKDESNDGIYSEIMASETFSEESFEKVIGGFKYIPVHKAEDIEIDGKIDDWEGKSIVTVPTLSTQYNVYINDGRTRDAKADCRFAYDEDYFYMIVEVKDDVHHSTYGRGNYWDGDSLQYVLSPLTESFGTEYGLAFDYETGELVSTSKVDGLKIAGEVNGDTAVYEIAFPWSARFDKRPNQFLFDFLVNDNDSDGRSYCAEMTRGISDGKYNSLYPLMECIEDDREVYAWLQSDSGRSLYVGEQYSFGHYILNKSDEAKTVVYQSDFTNGEVSVAVPAHSGVRIPASKAFEEEGKTDYTFKYSCDGISDEQVLNLTISEAIATAEETKVVIKNLETRAKELNKLIKKCRNKGIEPTYEEMHAGIIEEFAGYITEDLNNGIFSRVKYTDKVTNRIYLEDVSALNEYLAGTKEPRPVSTVLTGELTRDETNFYGDVMNADGEIENKPVFFNGYGHNLSWDIIENMPHYASNATQFEVGLSQCMSQFMGWSISDMDSDAKGKFSFDNEVFHGGKQSFKMEYYNALRGGVYYSVTQGMPVIPGHTYTFKGWIKGENLTDEFVIIADNWNWNASQRFKGTFDWQEFSINFTATSDVATPRLILQAKCDGIWLDDLEFFEVDNPDVNLCRNPDFEIGDGENLYFDPQSNYILSAIQQFEAAERANVYVDFMPNPQYMLDSVVEQFEMGMPNCGFLPYNPNHPVAKKLVEEFLRNIIPIVKDYKSLRSICLSNESHFQARNCGDFYNEQWWEFLRNRYNGDINALNLSYGTSYAEFNEVDMQSDDTVPAKNFDYWTFNSDIFAEWHAWLASIIRELAPGVPVHAKIMGWNISARSTLQTMGINYERYADIFDINGCDVYAYLDHDSVGGGLTKEMFYDYQQSVLEAPVFDSENHNVADGSDTWNEENGYHIARDIYNGAVHGRSNAVSWILTRNVAGQIMYRPDALMMTGDAQYDLNRNAESIVALQKEPHDVAILYLNESMINSGASPKSAFEAYRVVAYNGKAARFVVGSQLGKLDYYKVLIVPQLPYAEDAVFEKIADFIKNGGRVIIMGEETLSKTARNLEPNKELYDYIFANSEFVEFSAMEGKVTEQHYIDNLNEVYQKVLKEEKLNYIEVIDTETGKQATGVDCMFGIKDGKLIVNLANYRDDEGKDAHLKLIVNGKEITELTDLRKAEKVSGDITVKAYCVSTYEVDIDNPFFDTYHHWGENEIFELYEKGIVKGISASRFNPQANITRAEFLALVTRSCGLVEKMYTGKITDVTAEKWYANSVQSALDAGIITTDAFRPEVTITREEMCEILISAYEKLNGEIKDFEQANFTDNKDISDIELVSKAATLGIVKGIDDGSFAPKGNATRAEASAVINRFDNLKTGEDINE